MTIGVKPTEAQLAYLAGVVDGEGCVTVSTTPLFQLKQLDPESVSLLARIYNLRVARCKGRKDGRRPFEVRFGGARAIHFLQSVLPYLLIKRRQAELTIEWYSLPANCTRRRVIGEELPRLKRKVYEHEDASPG